MRLRVSGVVNVPFVFGGLHETMALIESIGRTVAQRAQKNWHLTSIGLRQEMT